MKRFLKVQSIALWGLVSAGINLGVVFGWWTPTPEQIGSINVVFTALVLVLRQMFSVTEPNSSDSAIPPSL